MASTDVPYIHDGSDNSWNPTIRKINAVLGSPPANTDCEPVDPLPEVDECHRWAAQDIIDAQNALKATCPSLTFTDVQSMDFWLKSVVEELENSLGDVWCDCDPDENQCLAPCENAAPPEEIFLRSHTVTDSDCTEEDPQNCAPLCADLQTLAAEYFVLLDEWGIIRNELCVLERAVTQLEEEVADLEEIKENACAGDPGSPACLTATENLEAKQEALDQKRAERDAKQIEDDNKLAEVEDKAATTEAQAYQILAYPGIDTSLLDLLFVNYPLAETDCASLDGRAVCADTDITRCRTTWVIQERLVSNEVPDIFCTQCIEFQLSPSPWATRLSGTWTPGGQVAVTGCSGCAGIPSYKVLSNSCGNPIRCVRGCERVTEYRLLLNFPFPFEPSCCNTLEPCTPGQPDQCVPEEEPIP